MNNPILVLAGSRAEYERCLHERGIEGKDAVFVCSEADLVGKRPQKVITYGTFHGAPNSEALLDLARMQLNWDE